MINDQLNDEVFQIHEIIYDTLLLIKLFTDAIMLVLFIYEFRLLKNLQYQILLEQHEKVKSKLQKMQTRFLQAQARNQNVFMNSMIWSVALMYIYWMVIRDMMVPIAYSELVDKSFRDRLVKTSMT